MRSSEAHHANISARLLVIRVRDNGYKGHDADPHPRYIVPVLVIELPSRYSCALCDNSTKDSQKGPRFKWQLRRKSQGSRDDSGRRMTAWPGYLANPMGRLDGIQLSEER